MNELEERLSALAEPVVARFDAELVELIVRRGRTNLVRLVVDREDGIDIDTCARVSEAVSRVLDAEDPLPGRYTLEVTSPGVDRPLRTPRDFRRNAGRTVRVILSDGQVEGTIEEVGEDEVVVRAGDERVPIRLDAVVKATIVLPW